MTRTELFEQIRRKRSFLCVGLDTDLDKIITPAKKTTQFPSIEDIEKEMVKDIFSFNKRIVDQTAEYVVAYKPNLAFYEAYGPPGIMALIKTCRYISNQYPEVMIIADAKRGDIGNTSDLYARAFISQERSFFDAVTLSPYMGRDTVEPFLKHPGKWAVILALTSNPSAADFESLELANGRKLYEQVLETASGWGTPENTMFVVGATKAEALEGIRKIVPDHFLLVPGVGAQGGSLEEVAKYGMNAQCGLLVNSSRGIIYAPDPAAAAREMQEQMAKLL